MLGELIADADPSHGNVRRVCYLAALTAGDRLTSRRCNIWRLYFITIYSNVLSGAAH
jgi:hypothetical protein